MDDTATKPKPGYFLLSFDTELAWGHFDCFNPAIFSADGRRERDALRRLLDMLDEYGIVATWAVVGKLFDPAYPDSWRGKYELFEAIHAKGNPLLHGTDFLDTLLEGQRDHEIAFHGNTHRVFTESAITAHEARDEIEQWVEAAAIRGIERPRTVIFPRNRIGHLDVFLNAGFICYRGLEAQPQTHTLPVVGRGFRRYNEYVAMIIPPQTYTLPADEGGLVNLPSSRWLFGMDRRIESFGARFRLDRLRTGQIIRGVKMAARAGKVIHLWAHPYEFRTDRDFETLRLILCAVHNEVRRGRMTSIVMGELAALLKQKKEDYARIDG
jgi:peptidoglycan/xylan/chitin deacetylase (PgdA/CDA1 family)